MSLFAKKGEYILDNMLSKLKQNTGITAVYPGTLANGIMSAFTSELVDAYNRFDINQAITTIYGATGDYLDDLGKLYHLTRITAKDVNVSPFVEAIKFYTYDDTVEVTIPANTEVYAEKNGEKIIYYTTTSVELNPDKQEGYTGIKSRIPGSINNIAPGLIKSFNKPNNTDYKNVFVTNDISIEDGVDNEDDNSFRIRILNAHLSLATGNSTAIKDKALLVPGVADVLVSPGYYGIGTTMVFVKTTTPIATQSVLDMVKMSISDILSSGEKIYVEGPDYIEMYFNITINTRPNYLYATALQKQVQEQIADYINNLDIGEAFGYNKLASTILADNDIVSMGTDRFFDKITIKKSPFKGAQQLEYVITTDYTPDANSKLTTNISNINITVKS